MGLLFMKISSLSVGLCACWLLAACAKEVPPPSVGDFRENPNLLEATVVRCAQDRALSKYEPECINALEAINQIAREDAKAVKVDLEAQSERKRRGLRRAQDAAAEARRRAAEAERERLEAEYMAQFDTVVTVLGGDGEAELSETVTTETDNEAGDTARSDD